MTSTQSGSPAPFAPVGVKVWDPVLHTVPLGEQIVVKALLVGSYQRAVGLVPSWFIATVTPPVPAQPYLELVA